jgi:transcriptional regulator with XRE-family HTH domain
MPSPDPDASPSDVNLGAVVQAIRLRRGWTLTQLSERCGLSPSALSKIERNKLSPTYSNLARLARGLEVNISQLFGTRESEADDRVSVMRLDEGDVVDTDIYVHCYLHMGPSARAMTPMLTDHRARNLEEFGPLVTHPGEEFSYVLSGVVDVYVGDHPPQRLRPGDSIYFNSNLPHAYLAVSRTPARTLCVCTELSRADLADYIVRRKAA